MSMTTNSRWVFILPTMNQMGVFNILHIILTPLTLNKLILIHVLPWEKKILNSKNQLQWMPQMNIF